MNDILLAYREKQLNAVVKKLFMTKKRKIEGVVSALFNNLNVNFWATLGEANQSALKELEDLLRFNLADVFELDSRAIENQLDSVREEFRRELETILRDKFQDLPNFILKKFKTLFHRGENGLPINWKSVKPEDIDKIFVEKQKEADDIFKAIKNFETRGGNLDLEHDAIITDHQLENFGQKINEDLRGELEEARRKHNSSEMANIPKWLWIVLVFFMYDDVLRWLATPILFYPLMLILGLVAVCFTIGHGDVPKAVVAGLWQLIRIFLGPYLQKIGLKV
jgi:hypothetical protein